ncbi:Hypothetical predicted protein [Olea europaea subsp. europaea]|uniref:HMG box domain-containing protein n=1 Tax=Olea europaea subsp. europaea TaxID=158383 RepID=A0A8S0UVH9_OLEEU|nr:Hypothetical predicted protein [Olea europaea subsp. europaea]
MKTSSRSKGTVRKETKEALKPVDDRKLGKRKAAVKADKKPAKKGKAAKKDPNKPKRPPSAFFVFLEEFRKTFKKENPDVKGVSAVGKAGGEKWKSMSAALHMKLKLLKRRPSMEVLWTPTTRSRKALLMKVAKNLRDQNLKFMMTMMRVGRKRKMREMRTRKKTMMMMIEVGVELGLFLCA